MINDAERREGLEALVRQRVGSTLNGKWRLDSLLGMGGMAAVYAATHRNGHRVAIKILHPHFCMDESLRARLQQEGYVANSIDHPGALRILDDDRAEDGAVFLVMELLQGEGLDARLKRKGWRLPRNEALAVTAGVLDVLAAAHAKGIVHRDIKPDNVFITRNGDVKVLDFGISRMRSQPDFMKATMGWTHQGALFGTLGFMAPEQALARSADIDGRTDLWAVGAMLFTVLSGRLVHEAPTANEQLVAAATRRAPPLSSVLPEADASLAALVDTALAFEPSERWQNASEMLDTLTAVALAGSPGVAAPADAQSVSALLQVPRVSVEIDLDPLLRGRWSSAHPRQASHHSAPPIAPSTTTFIAGGPRRLSATAATMLSAAIVVVVGGTAVRWVHGPGTLPAAAIAGSATGRHAATTEALDVVDIAPQPVSAIPAAMPAASPPDAVDEPAAQPTARQAKRSGPRRRLGGRVRTRRAQQAPSSVVHDDALWGRRH